MRTQFSKILTLAGVAVLALWGATDGASAGRIDFTNPAFLLASASPTSIPIGHAEFCRARPAECGLNTKVAEAVPLTQKKWDELLLVNAHFNTQIIPVTDQELYGVAEYWTYPAGHGDCEDYVLAKRQELMRRGWPASTLLITVVRQQNGEGHAVLMVRTDRGDLVLDNQEGAILLWDQTSYRFLKRQSQAHAGNWVDLHDNRPNGMVAAR